MWAGMTAPSRLYCMSASDHHGGWQAELGQPGRRKRQAAPRQLKQLSLRTGPRTGCHHTTKKKPKCHVTHLHHSPHHSASSLPGDREGDRKGGEWEEKWLLTEEENRGSRAAEKQSRGRGWGANRERDEADELMWMAVLMLRQSKLPSGPDYMLGS